MQTSVKTVSEHVAENIEDDEDNEGDESSLLSLVVAKTSNRRSALFDSHQLVFHRRSSRTGPRIDVSSFSIQFQRSIAVESKEIGEAGEKEGETNTPEYPAVLDPLQLESLVVLQKFDFKAFQTLIDLCREHKLCALEVDYMLHMMHNRMVMQHRYKGILRDFYSALMKNNLYLLFRQRIEEVFCTGLVDATKSAKKTALYHMIGHFIGECAKLS